MNEANKFLILIFHQRWIRWLIRLTKITKSEFQMEIAKKKRRRKKGKCEWEISFMCVIRLSIAILNCRSTFCVPTLVLTWVLIEPISNGFIPLQRIVERQRIIIIIMILLYLIFSCVPFAPPFLSSSSYYRMIFLFEIEKQITAMFSNQFECT